MHSLLLSAAKGNVATGLKPEDIAASSGKIIEMAETGTAAAAEAAHHAGGTSWWAIVLYLVASVLFIQGIKGLTHPRTAVRGNLMGSMGMLLAIVVTIIDQRLAGFPVIFAGLVVGGGVGLVLAVRIQMTSMPEMVALFNGFGGLASLIVAGAELHINGIVSGDLQALISIAAAGLIGSVTWYGSLVAFGKLQGYKWIKDGQMFPGQSMVTLLLALICLALCIVIVVGAPAGQITCYWLLAIVVGLFLGYFLTQPIGGADMPVVIALLNSYSGLAAAATGFAINNSVLIIAGSLVGASGLILTAIMCKAMNRSLPNVIFGTMASGGKAMDADAIYATVKSTSAEEIAMVLDGAQKVCIVPGYGMAVSQAQHAVHDLMKLLEERDVEVIFGVHPVAGRMPGHMNVLLAEADVPYEKLLEMDDVNSQMDQVDVSIVVGANDVVNPIAREPDSPIAGMPIIDVDKAKTCIVIKRSLSPGFAGIPNPLFALENTLMYFADGKKAFVDMIAAIKEG